MKNAEKSINGILLLEIRGVTIYDPIDNPIDMLTPLLRYQNESIRER